MEEQGNIITLLDPDGRECEFDILLSFDYENQRYVALMPTEPVDGIGEDEVLILSVHSEKGETVFDPIENPVLLDEVFHEFEDLFEETISEADEEEEDEGTLRKD